tara:strand:+ start:22921 stop:23505 length:585 start_codon:yes stop_codon:yes gene_type:complete
MQIEIKLSDKYLEYYKDHNKMPLPEYATSGSAAVDLVALKDYVIYPGEVVEINTGVSIWIGSDEARAGGCESLSLPKTSPTGWVSDELISIAAHIIPRSGRGAKEGLVIANTIGLIDEDYQGELIVYVYNRNLLYYQIEDDTNAYVDDEVINIKGGERFAQLYFLPIIKPTFKIVEKFSSSTERGEGGFHSTGD